jgi:hypothetical protein
MMMKLDRTPGFGVYVHWPFCAAKCPYCDFNSHVRHQPVDQERFARAFATASSTAPTVSGFISEGVPPPRKIEVTSRGPVRARMVANSVSKARENRS